MLSINNLETGDVVIIDRAPYAILKTDHQHMGRGGATVTLTIKNIKTGKVLERNYKSTEEFDEGEIEKINANFLYGHKDQYWFCETSNPKNRFELDSAIIGGARDLLKPNMEVTLLKFEGEIFNIELPIKADYKVVEAPPALKGNTAQGGGKTVVIESGAKILAPLFVNEGDVIRINTQTRIYTERVGKE